MPEQSYGTVWIEAPSIFPRQNIPFVEYLHMAWEVEFTDEFSEWWNSLNEGEQEDVQASVILLRERGPALGRPHVDLVTSSAYPNMKELRTQHNGKPYRTLFAFDPRRIAILLIGGDKTGNDRWYMEFVPRADKVYAEHLRQIEKETRKKC
jgi:hypothetical protein